ncbi:MAG: hypothetical protein FWG61_05805 [Firmicutes bacterium]|nr:hypothetical protein [Bacillota bacterium]
MDITNSQMHKILTGKQNFSMLSFSMLITKQKAIYARDSTPARLQACTDEVSGFIRKYSAVMRADITIISEL